MTAKTSAPKAPAKKAGKPAGYAEQQIKKGRAARLAGASWTKVAEAAGVKSEAYFSRVLRDRFPELNAPVKNPAESVPAATAKPPAKRRAAKKPAAA